MDLLQRCQQHYSTDSAQLGLGADIVADLSSTTRIQSIGHWLLRHHGVSVVILCLDIAFSHYLTLISSAYATRFKDLKNPLLFTYTIFLVTTICYATIQPTPSYDRAQYSFAVLAGIGQSGPLTLILALVQFAAPHAFIATASGFALSARAIGGAFGSAVLDAIINGRVAADLAPKVTAAAKAAGLSSSSIALLLEAFETGEGFDDIPGINGKILGKALEARSEVYAHAYRLAWSSVIPFVVLAIVAVCFVKNVKEQMTDHVEASVENKRVFEKGAADGA